MTLIFPGLSWRAFMRPEYSIETRLLASKLLLSFFAASTGTRLECAGCSTNSAGAACNLKDVVQTRLGPCFFDPF